MMTIMNKLQDMLDTTRKADFLAPLLLRAYLVPIFYEAGIKKANNFAYTVLWFEGLGLPMPWVMAFLATAAELGGATLLAFGLATRWITIPLIFTMLVAIVTVHWSNGWLAIAGGGLFGSERTAGAAERLSRGRSILEEHGHYDWLTANGPFVILNNGIEFATTYIIMLLALFFIGGGRFVSVDYWVSRQFRTGQ